MARRADEERRAKEAEERRIAAESDRRAEEIKAEAERQIEEARRAEEQRLAKETEETRHAEERQAAEDRRAEAQRRALETAREEEARRLTEKLRRLEDARGGETAPSSPEKGPEMGLGAGRDAQPDTEDESPVNAARDHKMPYETAGAGTRVTILLIMDPGKTGIRRYGLKTADPVLCMGTSCWVSAGPDRSAVEAARGKVLGPGNTLGRRAAACNHSLGCVFRDVDLKTDSTCPAAHRPAHHASRPAPAARGQGRSLVRFRRPAGSIAPRFSAPRTGGPGSCRSLWPARPEKERSRRPSNAGFRAAVPPLWTGRAGKAALRTPQGGAAAQQSLTIDGNSRRAGVANARKRPKLYGFETVETAK